MNKYTLRYVIGVVTQDERWLERLLGAEDPDDVLRWYDVYDLLSVRDRHLVMNELDEIAVAEQFKARHRMVIRA